MEAELELHLRARDPMLWLSSMEEDRSAARVVAVTERLGLAGFIWSCTNGFVQFTSGEVRQPGDGRCTNIDLALDAVGQYGHEQAVFVMRDLDLLASRLDTSPDYVALVRRIKDLYGTLRSNGTTVVFQASTSSVPVELADCLTLIEVSLPSQSERLAVVGDWIAKNARGIPCELDDETIHLLGAVSAGMSSRQVQSALANSLVKRKALSADTTNDVLVEKVAAVKTSEVLEYVRVPETLDDVGGLAGVKEYVRRRAHAFSPAAERYGLPTPKGMLILGPPGTGKSLTAKATAAELHMPLLRFDIGRVQGSLVGQSEERMRRALEIVEVQAPCVLWIDELEKAFAGVTGPSGDSGVTQRQFGSLLHWMQERTVPVFIVATANNIQQLPPEFLRKGRFDEIFFADLPTATERRAILKVLLRKYKRRQKGLVTTPLVKKLDRFTGAEIEYVICEALYEAYYDDQRTLTAKDLEGATAKILPIADQMREQIEALRRWGRANARPASCNAA